MVLCSCTVSGWVVWGGYHITVQRLLKGFNQTLCVRLAQHSKIGCCWVAPVLVRFLKYIYTAMPGLVGIMSEDGPVSEQGVIRQCSCYFRVLFAGVVCLLPY